MADCIYPGAISVTFMKQFQNLISSQFNRFWHQIIKMILSPVRRNAQVAGVIDPLMKASIPVIPSFCNQFLFVDMISKLLVKVVIIGFSIYMLSKDKCKEGEFSF